MNLERLRWGEWIAAIAAIDLLLVTFRAWYKVSGGGGRVTAWDALDSGRYLLIATAIVGIFLLLFQAAEDTQRLSFPPGWIAAVVGLACTVYVAYRLATPPSDNLDADLGLFLGLASAVGVSVGGLLSAREPEPSHAETLTQEVAPSADPFAVPDPTDAAAGQTWSPAAPVASSAGWSPASPAAPLPPAPAAGALEGALRPGDPVVLTAGSTRFPAGTVAEVVEVFTGGALVEVRAADGMAERFEVPESAYEPASAAGAAAESWRPAMPAAASQDWGFDESSDGGVAAGLAEPEAKQPKPDKVPWWKREIGGGKKKKQADEPAEAEALAAGAAAVEADSNGAAEEKPGFFKRVFGGGGSKAEPEATAGEDEPWVSAADAEPEPWSSEPEPEAAASEPEPEAITEPEPPAFAPEPEPPASAPEPEPAAPEPEPAPAEPEVVVDPVPPAAPEPEPAASEPEPPVSAPEPDPPASAAEPEVVADPDPPASEPEPSVSIREPEVIIDPPVASEPEPEPAAEPDPPAPPKRRRSSGSRKVPKEVLDAAADQPKVGDEVQLKVGGGKYDAGAKGTVVDVFSAGVIVEFSDDEGRTERLDLPFEAIGPADA